MLDECFGHRVATEPTKQSQSEEEWSHQWFQNNHANTRKYAESILYLARGWIWYCMNATHNPLHLKFKKRTTIGNVNWRLPARGAVHVTEHSWKHEPRIATLKLVLDLTTCPPENMILALLMVLKALRPTAYMEKQNLRHVNKNDVRVCYNGWSNSNQKWS